MQTKAFFRSLLLTSFFFQLNFCLSWKHWIFFPSMHILKLLAPISYISHKAETKISNTFLLFIFQLNLHSVPMAIYLKWYVLIGG